MAWHRPSEQDPLYTEVQQIHQASHNSWSVLLQCEYPLSMILPSRQRTKWESLHHFGDTLQLVFFNVNSLILLISTCRPKYQQSSFCFSVKLACPILCNTTNRIYLCWVCAYYSYSHPNSELCRSVNINTLPNSLLFLLQNQFHLLAFWQHQLLYNWEEKCLEKVFGMVFSDVSLMFCFSLFLFFSFLFFFLHFCYVHLCRFAALFVFCS